MTAGIEEAMDAMRALELSQSGIPEFACLGEQLAALAGWRVVPVAGLIPDDDSFEHLASRRFLAGAFIRPEHELDNFGYRHRAAIKQPTQSNF